MSKLLAWLLLALQMLSPKHAMTAAVYRVARIRLRPVKDFLIRRFVSMYAIDVEEADHPVPDGYASLNDFFTRSLVADARPIERAAATIVSPVDGTVSAAGAIESTSLLQAKGKRYSLSDLLMTDVPDAERFVDGQFATLYLAPHNYHRVHSPMNGRLIAARYVPGSLYSVNDASVSLVPGLFTRNERLICHFDGEPVSFALVFVGALNVGSISTPWTDEIRPRRKGTVQEFDLQKSDHSPDVKKGDCIGHFNMGSTVVLLFPPDAVTFEDTLVAGSEVRMGRAIGHVAQAHRD
ncbi:MAG: archaetidylserine decarboxylase [Woeseiaceae bacterium]|nr:archaetidylserine decarboxylase [Woeseiaceae bacterium]